MGMFWNVCMHNVCNYAIWEIEVGFAYDENCYHFPFLFHAVMLSPICSAALHY